MRMKEESEEEEEEEEEEEGKSRLKGEEAETGYKRRRMGDK